MKFNQTKRISVITILALMLFWFLGGVLKNQKDNKLENMQVVLTAKVLKDDFLQFFYWEKHESKFQIKNSVRLPVKGNSDFQKIVFQLPTIVDLYRIRLDIGENKKQEAVQIQQIKFIKEDEQITLGEAEFNRLFAANKYIEKKATNTFMGLEGKSGERIFYDPYFISRDASKEMGRIKTNYFTHYPYLISGFVSLVLFLFALYNLHRLSVSEEHLFIAAFLLILVLPTLQSQIEFITPLESLEKRVLAEKPKLELSKKFARNYEAYYDDNFGLRNTLVNWGGTYRTKLFRSSMHPELVLFGKEKWLFYNKMNGRMFRSYSRTRLLSDEEQNKIANNWQANKERYEAEGRKYFLGFWPNKNSIYREYIPYTMDLQIKDTISRVDQLIKRTQASDIKVKLTDVRPKLLESKTADKPLYRKFDSHWNDYGAFLAYQDFFRQNPALGMQPKTEQDFDIQWKDYTGGELIQMLGVRNKGYFLEKKPVFTLKENKDQIQYLPIDGFPRLTVITKNEYSGNKLRALIFRDSFTNSLIPFFSLHFYEVYYIWGHHEKYVKQLQPDVIIDGFVEREIGEKIP